MTKQIRDNGMQREDTMRIVKTGSTGRQTVARAYGKRTVNMSREAALDLCQRLNNARSRAAWRNGTIYQVADETPSGVSVTRLERK